MKPIQVILLVSTIISGIPIYGQQQDTLVVNTIEDAINKTLKEFRTRIDDEDATIYCIVTNSLNMNLVDFNEKNLLVKNTINAKYINRNTPSYLITFNLVQKESGIVIDVATSSIKKISRRLVEFNVRSFAITKTYKIMAH